MEPQPASASASIARRQRKRTLEWLSLCAIALALVIGSTPRRVGDGWEYMAMAHNLGQGLPPALSPEDLTGADQRFEALQASLSAASEIPPNFANPAIRFPALVGRDGRQDFPHFWFYSALASPWARAAEAVGLPPTHGFTAVNLALFILVAWLATGKARWPHAAFLLFGPVVWWLDKAHTEVFTYCLLTIAMLLLEDRPWWALVALGAASTQNPPFLLALPVVAVSVALSRREWLKDRRVWFGGIAAAGLSALHPLYYELRLGALTPTSVAVSTHYHLPSVRRLLAVVTDSNIGLLTNFPMLAVMAALVLWCLRSKLPRAPSVWVTVPLLLLFLFAFAQTTNVNHGGTPNPSRYGLWLIPLIVPWLLIADEAATPRQSRLLRGLAVLSAAVCALQFHPLWPESYCRETALARWLWDRFPSVADPLAEIFFERVSHHEMAAQPVATESCSKVLTIGGAWPYDCPPPPGTRTAACDAPGAFCYANRGTDGRYELVTAEW